MGHTNCMLGEYDTLACNAVDITYEIALSIASYSVPFPELKTSYR